MKEKEIKILADWRELCVDDDSIKGVYFHPKITERLQTIAKESVFAEQGGYIGGVLKDGLFYAVYQINEGYHFYRNRLEKENNRNKFKYEMVEVDGQSRPKFWYDETRQFSYREPGITEMRDIGTILTEIPEFSFIGYHSHPKISSEFLRKIMGVDGEKIITSVNEDIKNGVFDHLLLPGRTKLTLDDALTEVLCRDLSFEDILGTYGNSQVLISPTIYENNPKSFINSYRIDKNKINAQLIGSTLFGNSQQHHFMEEIKNKTDKICKQSQVRNMRRFKKSARGLTGSEIFALREMNNAAHDYLDLQPDYEDFEQIFGKERRKRLRNGGTAEFTSYLRSILINDKKF